MRVIDAGALRAVSPTAQKAYALSAGWSKLESFGDHSDVYADEMPEIILPPTELIDDYPSAVSELIKPFTRTASTDELTLYRELETADLNVVRVRGTETSFVTIRDIQVPQWQYWTG